MFIRAHNTGLIKLTCWGVASGTGTPRGPPGNVWMSGLWECHGVHVWDWHWGGGRKTKDWFPRHITELDAHIDRYQWELSICGSSSIIWGTKTLFVFINFCFLVLGWGVEKKFWQENNKSGSTYWQFSMRSVVMWIECYHMMENTLFFRPPGQTVFALLRPAQS